MKKIGFKNFCRFKDFPMIELGGCTFLVGPNNSGKSTLLKAMVLIENNRVRLSESGLNSAVSKVYVRIKNNRDRLSESEMKSVGSSKADAQWAKIGVRLSDTRIPDPILWDFSFASHYGQTEHLYLGDFLSNLNDNAQEKEITFSFQLGNTDFSIVTDGSSFDEKNPSVLVDLKKFTAYNSEYDIRFEWNFINEKSGILQYTFNPKVVINKAETYVNELSKRNFCTDDFIADDTTFRADIDAFIAELKTADTLQTESVKFWTADWKAFIEDSKTADTLQIERLNFVANDVIRPYSDAQRTNLLLFEFLRHAKYAINSDFTNITRDDKLKYIENHNASHKVLLDPEDKNDYLAQTVLQYLSGIRVKQEDEAYKFVIHWMKELKIGVDFIIMPIRNEAYIVDIEGFDGKTKSIGYFGTGSIQLFILLLRIAMAIHSRGKVTLYIEEPEQNLHPALQSKLAEMFYDVWKSTKGMVEFVVETHSEYIIRKTQVLVAEQNYKDENELKEKNPFKVYYFPCDETPPYEMTYRKDGKFSDKFRPGFFDEAANLAFKIF